MKQSAILMAITIIGKIFGLLREVSLSYVYGTGYVADAFLVAFFIPSILLNGVTVGISTGFIPIYSKLLERDGRDEADKFTNNVINLTAIVSTVIMLLGILFSERIINILGYGFSPEVKDTTIFFTRLIMTSIAVSSVAGVYRGYLQVYNHFSVTSVNVIIMNMCLIIFIFLSGMYGYRLLGIGAAIAMNIQYIIFLPAILKTGYKYEKTLNIFDKNLEHLFKITLPILAGVLVNEINVVVDKAIASSLKTGAISALNYSSGVQEFVVGVVIMSIITVKYPEMSKLSSNNEREKLIEVYNKTVSMTLYLVIPATLGLAAFSEEIVRMLFFRGAFDENSLFITSRSLFYYALGLVGISLNTISQRVFYAEKKIKEPIFLSLGSIAFNVFLNLKLSKTMGVSGLALATSISISISGILGVSLLKSDGIYLTKDTLIEGFLKNFASSVPAILLAKLIYNISKNSISLIVSIIAAIVFYIFIGLKTGTITVDELKSIIKKE